MTTSKRSYEDVDPDYAYACEQQAKRQRELEQDAKQQVSRRIQGIVRNEFRKEINNKELELHQVDKRLNEARINMDRLRACIISTYYGQMNQSGTSELSRMNGPPASIHPAVKKYLGKKPAHHELNTSTSVDHIQSTSRLELSFNDDCADLILQSSDNRQEQQNRTSVRFSEYQSPVAAASCSSPSLGSHAVPVGEAMYDDRRARFKIKKKIIIGNVSKYIPVDHREANDKSSHKWMVYVRGPKSEPNISGFVKKVWFFLHHSYKPNDLVEISSPPFHLTRRGWGEFPVRVQLHFVDPRNKKVDIIHQLKLDKTFSGLQTLGAETTVELDLEKDFFESEPNNSIIYTKPTLISSLTHQQAQLSSTSVLNAASTVSGHQLPHLRNSGVASEQFETFPSSELEVDKNNSDKMLVTDAPSVYQNVMRNQDSCATEVSLKQQSVCEIERVAGDIGDINSLEEYNVTIVHDTDECEDQRKEEQNMIVDVAVSDGCKLVQENNSMDSSVTSSLLTCSPASLLKVQPSLSTITSSTKTTLTVINRPVWRNPEHSEKSDSVARTLQIIQPHQLAGSHFGFQQSQLVIPAKIDNLASDVASVNPLHCLETGQTSMNSAQQILKPCIGTVQTSSYLLMAPNGHCVKPVSSSSITNVKQLRLPVSSPSLLPLSLSALPKLNTPEVILTPSSGSVQSSAVIPLSLPKNSIITASTTSEIVKLTVDPGVVSLSQQVKESRPQYLTSDGQQKVIILNSNTPGVTPELPCTNTAGFESKSLLLPKPNGHRQVSLLTGRVFTPQTPSSSVTNILPTNHRSTESLLTNNCAVVKQTHDQTPALHKPANHITKSITKPGGKIILLKTVNVPSLPISQPTGHSTNQIKSANGLVMQVLASQTDKVSIVNAEGSTNKPPLAVSLMSNSGPLNNVIIQGSHNTPMDTQRANVVLRVPGQEQFHIMNSQNSSSYPKMSAIGITKFGKNPAIHLAPSTNSRSTTDEERKRNQYEVLMAWKRNRHLHEKSKQVAKMPRDRIEGEADIIPDLNLDDYTSMGALVKAAVKLHPLVQAGINKLTHPYSAESLKQWTTWTLGKQLASEWHRACFVLKYLKLLLGQSGNFRGEELMTTRQLVRWCRLHAFSPLFSVIKAKSRNTDDNTDRNSSTPQNCSHTPCFTPADTLEKEILSEVAVAGSEDDSKLNMDLLDVVTTDTDRSKRCTNKMSENIEDDVAQEWVPHSDGALFVYDELRKRGIKLHPNELQPGVISFTSADMLYRAMQEFLADVLRETVAVSAEQTSYSSATEITRRDVHKALTELPEAAFICNKFLGKAKPTSDDFQR